MDSFASEFADDHARQMAEEDFPCAVSDRGWEVAHDLAGAIEAALAEDGGIGRIYRDNLAAALRRYEEERN